VYSRSKASSKALSGGWKQSQERLVNLPEGFRLYVHYLYSGNLAVTEESGAWRVPNMRMNLRNLGYEDLKEQDVEVKCLSTVADIVCRGAARLSVAFVPESGVSGSLSR
jgi:hypothetical protein